VEERKSKLNYILKLKKQEFKSCPFPNPGPMCKGSSDYIATN
jgi:hypothetical protein